MRGVIADVRHAWRVYRSTPVSSSLAVLVLAAAMAFVCAFLSLWDDLALKPHAGFDRSGGLVTIGQSNGINVTGISLDTIEDVGAHAATVESIAGSARGTQYVDWGQGTEPLQTEAVTAQYFPMLEPRLALGRAFDASDHRNDAAPVAILSYRLWQQRFGGRQDVLGRRLTISGPHMMLRGPSGTADAAKQSQDYRIVGVMSERLAGTFDDTTEVWMPFEQAAPVLLGGAGDLYRHIALLQALARPRGGASLKAVRAELNARFANAPAGPGGRALDAHLEALPGIVMNIPAARDARRQVLLFTAGSLLVALVAACNISLFLLSRAAVRRRELGIRMAVGAPLKRLARQLATEAGLLVLAAAVLGLLGSVWIAAALRDSPILAAQHWRAVSPLDWRVLAIVVGLSLLLTALVSVAPAVGLRRAGIAESSRHVTARAGVGQWIAGTAELAIAGVVGGAACAFLWYSTWLSHTDWGFDPRGVVVLRPTPPKPGAGLFNPDIKAVFGQRERRRQLLLSLPGVDEVAFGTSVPGRQMRGLVLRVPAEFAGGNDVLASVESSDPQYPDALGMKLVDGHALDATDTSGVLVNETFARKVWGKTHVAGQKTRGFGPNGGTITGVLRDVPYGNPREGVQPMAFFVAAPTSIMDSIIVKGSVTPAALRAMVQQKIDAGDLDLQIASIEPLTDIWGQTLGPDRARTRLTSATAVLVALLAAFGFYGMQRYLVTAGRREYAVRAAVGAGPKALGRLVVSRALALAAPGTVLGTLLALVVCAWMRGTFVAEVVSPFVVAGSVAAAMVALVVAAVLGPARQARRSRAGWILREE